MQKYAYMPICKNRSAVLDPNWYLVDDPDRQKRKFITAALDGARRGRCALASATCGCSYVIIARRCKTLTIVLGRRPTINQNQITRTDGRTGRRTKQSGRVGSPQLHRVHRWTLNTVERAAAAYGQNERNKTH